MSWKHKNEVKAHHPMLAKSKPKSNRYTLDVVCLALHGDMCSLSPHCEEQGCASGVKSTDYVVVARFRFLQEAIDYCVGGARRGVHMNLVSYIAGPDRPYTQHYSPQPSLSPQKEGGEIPSSH